MKNRGKMGPKIDHFSDCLGDGVGFDLGPIWGPCWADFRTPNQKNMLKKTSKNMSAKKLCNQKKGHATPPSSLKGKIPNPKGKRNNSKSQRQQGSGIRDTPLVPGGTVADFTQACKKLHARCEGELTQLQACSARLVNGRLPKQMPMLGTTFRLSFYIPVDRTTCLGCQQHYIGAVLIVPGRSKTL